MMSFTTTQREQAIKNILSGGIAGCISKTGTAPLERVQMLNQTGALHDSIANTLRRVFNAGGIRGLWTGNFANCVRVFPHKSILFACNEYLSALPAFSSFGDKKHFLTGGVSGFMATTVTYPIDLIRANIAGTFDVHSKSMASVVRHVIREKGVLALYAGYAVTIAGGIPYESLRIGCYGYLRSYLPLQTTDHGMQPHPIAILLCGASAGAAAGIGTYPTDTVRRMLQVQTADGMPTYSSLSQCLIINFREGGIRRFYQGLSAKLVRVVPDAAILFIAYENLKHLL